MHDLETAPIPGFPEYSIRSDGKVFKHNVEKVVSCKKGRSAKVVIRKMGKMYTLGLATLIAEAFLPNPFNLKHVIFRDRDHHNCHKNNIAWVDKETYFLYCCKTLRRGRPKTYVEREVAIKKATDENIRNYYLTLDEEWLEEAWKEISADLSQMDCWPFVLSEVYLNFLDRARRFSILGKGAGLMWFYARAEHIKLKKTISPRLPIQKLLQTDESLRIINPNSIDGARSTY